MRWQKNNFEIISKIFSNILPQLNNYITENDKNLEAILIFCEDGQNKSLCIVVCFLMKKYKWGFVKCLHFINNKRKNLEIKKNYFKPLQKIANEFEHVNKVSHNFLDEFYSDFPEEEILLRNTYLNSSDMFFEKDFHKYHNIVYKKNKFKKNFSKNKNERLSITKNNKMKKTTKSLGRKKKYKKKIQWIDKKKKSKSVKKNYKTNKNICGEKKNLNDLHKKNKEEILKSMKHYNLKKLENFLKTNIKTNEKNKIDNLCVSSSIEFYKNNLKNLQRKIFSKTKDRNKKRIKSNKSSSKVSTNIIEEFSTSDALLKNSKNIVKKKNVLLNFQKKNFLSNFKNRKIYNNFFKKNNKKYYSNKKKYLKDDGSKNLNTSQKSNSRKYQSLERQISKSKQQNVKDTFSKILKISKKKKDFNFNHKFPLNYIKKKEKEVNKKKILKKNLNELENRLKRPCSAPSKEKIKKSNKILLEKKKLFSNYKNLFQRDIFIKSKNTNKDNFRGYSISKKILKI